MPLNFVLEARPVRVSGSVHHLEKLLETLELFKGTALKEQWIAKQLQQFTHTQVPALEKQHTKSKLITALNSVFKKLERFTS